MTDWMKSYVMPPPASPMFVLAYFGNGEEPRVEVVRAENVREYPYEYPWWMPLPAPPGTASQPSPARFAAWDDCEVPDDQPSELDEPRATDNQSP